MRSIVREVVGFSPYERRVMELLRNSKVRPFSGPVSCTEGSMAAGRLVGQEGEEADEEAGECMRL